MKYVCIIFFSLCLLGCFGIPKPHEYEDAVGVYELTKFTNEDLYSKFKDDEMQLFVYSDLTFEIKAKKDLCFTNQKGTWSVEHDIENTNYVLELNGKRQSQPMLSIWVQCDTINGVLVFGGPWVRKPFK